MNLSNLRRNFLPFLVAITLPGATGCGAGAGPAEVSASAPASGVDLFRGVFLHEGPVATRLGDERPPSDPRVATVHALLLERLAEEPGFFERFGVALQSGDPVVVDEALEDATRRTDGILRALGEEPRPELATAPPVVILVLPTLIVLWFDDGSLRSSGRLSRAERVEALARKLQVP